MGNFEHIYLPWSGWKIVKYLGGGAYGKVYEIERNNSGIQEKAAVKIVSRPKEESELEVDYQNGYDRESIAVKYTEILQEYKNEYKLMKELQGQSNIVSCDDFAIEENPDGIGGKIYIRMELLTPLQKVTKERLLSEEEVIKLGKDICKALILCESRNIIHRDIKPDNIMISKFGDYKLGDFGVSKVMSHTTGATMTGTEGYMAPEVLHIEKYGKEVDIYSLGIVMYWLLNNRRMPFIGADEKVTLVNANQAAMRRYQGEKIPAPKNGSNELKKIVLKACEYKPKDRYLTAQEMYDALEEIGSGTVYRYEPEPFSNPVHGHPAGSFLEDDWMESGKTGEKTVDGIREEDTARREALIALQRILKERMIYMQKNSESVEETRGGLNGGQTAGNSWGGSETIGKLKGNTKKEEKQEESVSETIGVKKTSSEDSWMESGETIGKTMGAFSGGQTVGNSWGETGETIGKPKRNTKKKKKEEKQKEVQEEPVTETIGVKKAYQKQEKKAEEKKEVTAENKPKKVTKTKFGYIWSVVVIGFFCFFIYEWWNKEGLAGFALYILAGGNSNYTVNTGIYNTLGIIIIALVFFVIVLPKISFLLFDVEKTYPKRDEELDGMAACLIGIRLTVEVLNIIGDVNTFVQLNTFVLIIVFLLSYKFCSICYVVGKEWINDRCYDYE